MKLKLSQLAIYIIIELLFLGTTGLIYWYFFSNKGKNKDESTDSNKITIVTALPGSQSLLEDTIKPDVQKSGYQLDVKLLSQDYSQTSELVDKGEAIAKLDSHLSYERIFNNCNFQVITPFYFAKFAIYNNKDAANGIKDEATLRAKIKELKLNLGKLKILLPDNAVQKSLALRLLESKQIITRKDERSDDKLQADKMTLLQLTETDYTIPSYLEFAFENLQKHCNAFKNNEYDLFINYPGVVGAKELEQLTAVMTLTKPTNPHDILNLYYISLISKPDSAQNKALIACKESLIKNLTAYYAKFKEYVDIPEADKIEEITTYINNFFR